jgi:hypothetical protein
VTADSGVWAVIGKIPGRLTVIEGGKRVTTFRTYDTSNLLNPLVVLTEQDLAQRRRISSPPFSVPGDVDQKVMDALGLGEGPMVS